MDDTSDFLVRCRLSDEVSAATEFSACDAKTLAVGCDRAIGRYAAAHGDPRTPLVLQVRPVSESQTAAGWWSPIRGRTPVVVRVSRDILDRRPPDDWTEIWGWVVAARGADRRFGEFADNVRDLVEGGDADAR